MRYLGLVREQLLHGRLRMAHLLAATTLATVGVATGQTQVLKVGYGPFNSPLCFVTWRNSRQLSKL